MLYESRSSKVESADPSNSYPEKVDCVRRYAIRLFLMSKNKGFSENLFSFEPTPETSNEVYLTNDYSSYQCEIHPDKVTSTQITCYAP